MSIELELYQYESEIKYSKKNLIKIIKNSIDSSDTSNVTIKLLAKVNEYLHGDWWSSKNDYITAICMSDVCVEDIVDHLLICGVKHNNTVVNNIANDIGNMFSEYIDDVFIRVQIGADILFHCEDIIYELVKRGDNIMFSSWISLDSNEQLLVSKLMYQPPMVCKPLHISNNYMSGYLTFNESVILGSKVKSHNKPIRLDVINTLNSIGFVLDKDTCNKIHKSKDELLGVDLDNWSQYIKEQDMLIEDYKDRKFYFNHKLDSRQRIYSQGWHINYQGDEHNKAMVNLAKYEKVELD